MKFSKYFLREYGKLSTKFVACHYINLSWGMATSWGLYFPSSFATRRGHVTISHNRKWVEITMPWQSQSGKEGDVLAPCFLFLRTLHSDSEALRDVGTRQEELKPQSSRGPLTLNCHVDVNFYWVKKLKIWGLFIAVAHNGLMNTTLIFHSCALGFP